MTDTLFNRSKNPRGIKLSYPSMGPGGKPIRAPRTEHETESHLSRTWGIDYDDNLQAAKDILAEFGSEEFVEYLENSGLGNFSPMLRGLYDVHLQREAAIKEASRGLSYDGMEKLTVQGINNRTRDNLNIMFNDVKDQYVRENGTISTALPQTDMFKPQGD